MIHDIFEKNEKFMCQKVRFQHSIKRIIIIIFWGEEKNRRWIIYLTRILIMKTTLCNSSIPSSLHDDCPGLILHGSRVKTNTKPNIRGTTDVKKHYTLWHTHGHVDQWHGCTTHFFGPLATGRVLACRWQRDIGYVSNASIIVVRRRATTHRAALTLFVCREGSLKHYQ